MALYLIEVPEGSKVEPMPDSLQVIKRQDLAQVYYKLGILREMSFGEYERTAREIENLVKAMVAEGSK